MILNLVANNWIETPKERGADGPPTHVMPNGASVGTITTTSPLLSQTIARWLSSGRLYEPNPGDGKLFLRSDGTTQVATISYDAALPATYRQGLVVGHALALGKVREEI